MTLSTDFLILLKSPCIFTEIILKLVSFQVHSTQVSGWTKKINVIQGKTLKCFMIPSAYVFLSLVFQILIILLKNSFFTIFCNLYQPIECLQISRRLRLLYACITIPRQWHPATFLKKSNNLCVQYSKQKKQKSKKIPQNIYPQTDDQFNFDTHKFFVKIIIVVQC